MRHHSSHRSMGQGRPDQPLANHPLAMRILHFCGFRDPRARSVQHCAGPRVRARCPARARPSCAARPAQRTSWNTARARRAAPSFNGECARAGRQANGQLSGATLSCVRPLSGHARPLPRPAPCGARACSQGEGVWCGSLAVFHSDLGRSVTYVIHVSLISRMHHALTRRCRCRKPRLPPAETPRGGDVTEGAGLGPASSREGPVKAAPRGGPGTSRQGPVKLQ